MRRHQEPVDRGSGPREPLLLRPVHEHPRRPARPAPLEIAVVHPSALLLELPDPVVPPRHVEPADDEEVVAPLEEIVEGVGRLAEIDLVEDARS